MVLIYWRVGEILGKRINWFEDIICVMRVAVSSTGKTMESEVDIRFSQCPYFIFLDIEKGKIKESSWVKNPGAGLLVGAGPAAAELMGREKIDVVITGSILDEAYIILKQLGIKVYRGLGKVSEAVEKFIDGKLERIEKKTE